MARKSAPKTVPSKAPMSNQFLIAQAINTFNMVGENSNQEILDMLLRQEHNLDCIIDDDERAAVAESYGWNLPTESDRVEYINNQVKLSTNEKGRNAWLSMLDGDVLVDRRAYHALRNQRLREQIRQTKKKEESANEAAEARALAINSTGRAEAVNWEDIESTPLKRVHTFHPKLDEWFGVTVDKETVKKRGKEEIREIRTYGMASGFSYVIGAGEGMGKTRFLIKLLGYLCGPKQVRDDGIEFGGLRGLYIQNEMDMGMFTSTFLRNNWEPGKVNVSFSEASLLRDVDYLVRRDKPDIIVIDSRSMIYELNGPDSRVEDGMLRLNALLGEHSAIAFVTSHLSKTKGDLKGSTKFGHLAHATIIGNRDEHQERRFSLMFQKNRGGLTRKPIGFVHGDHGVELDEEKVIKSEGKPDMTRLSARDARSTDGLSGDSLSETILATIAMNVNNQNNENTED